MAMMAKALAEAPVAQGVREVGEGRGRDSRDAC